MQPIPAEVSAYLNSQLIGVLAIELSDGSPHAAAMHIAHTDSPFELYIKTNIDSKKCELLRVKGSARASVVVGTHKPTMQTFQADGVVRLIPESQRAAFAEVFFGKFPGKAAEAVNDPKVAFIIFTPSWWRFSDPMAAGEQKIWTSA